MNEYIIVNKTAIQKRIDEIVVEQKNVIKKLKELYDNLKNTNKYFDLKDNISRHFTNLTNEKRLLEKLISQSTPLIPEIEKTFHEGTRVPYDKSKPLGTWWVNADQRFEEYISNLKLDI
jgi:hypothetical protein